MTVEKAVLAGIPEDQRLRGCLAHPEARAFSVAIARKHDRVAFPNEFVAAVRPIQKRIQDKHGRDSDEGRVLAALREIRVACAPSWAASELELTFLFIFEEAASIPNRASEVLEALVARFKAVASFKDPAFRVLATDTMTAAAYLGSDPFDLDHLSSSIETEGT